MPKPNYLQMNRPVRATRTVSFSDSVDPIPLTMTLRKRDAFDEVKADDAFNEICNLYIWGSPEHQGEVFPFPWRGIKQGELHPKAVRVVCGICAMQPDDIPESDRYTPVELLIAWVTRPDAFDSLLEAVDQIMNAGEGEEDSQETEDDPNSPKSTADTAGQGTGESSGPVSAEQSSIQNSQGGQIVATLRSATV